MKHLRLIPLVLILSILLSFVVAAAYPAPTLGAQDVAQKWADGKILSIAHRAAYRSAPENSLLAIEAAILMGIDMLELDIKQTSDGVIVVSHDKTIDRVTMGSGTISSMTWSKIKSYALEPELGNVGSAYKLTNADANLLNRLSTYKQYIGTATSGGTLPMARLEQVIELVQKRCMLSLDYAMDTEASFAACYVLFREAGMLDHVLFKDSMSISALNGMYAAAAAKWNESHTPTITAKDVQASIMYLHIRGSSGSTSDLQNLLNNGDNVVMTEVSIGKTADESGVKNTVEPWCISKGIALEAYTQVGYFGARTDNEICWADAINRGYVAIQTDRPSELATYLNAINHDRYATSTIQAEHFNSYSGTFTVPDAADSNLNKTVQSIQNGSQLCYENIIFSGKENQIRFVAAGGSKAATVKVYVDSTSNQVASFSVAAKAASKTYAIKLSKAITAGKHKVYIAVSGTASTALLTADRFAFTQTGEHVFFNFDNSTAAKERYSYDSVYGGYNYDVDTAWWTNSATKAITTTNGGYLTIGTNSNADRNYCSIYPAGTESNRSNYPLSFTPSKNDIVQIRFRVNEGCVLETTDMRVSMQYRLSSATADSDKNFQSTKATKIGQFYTLTYPAPAEWGTTTDKVTGIWFTFHNIKGTGTVDVDYVYAGPAADAPVDDRILFDFTNRAEDTFRYSTMLYGNYPFDSSAAAWWSNSAEKSLDNSGNGHITIGMNSNIDRTYCTLYPAGTGANRNHYAIQYRPTGSEVIKIRFKLSKECTLSSSVGVAMQYRLSNATEDSAQIKLSVSKPVAETYYTLTFATPDAWKNTTADVIAVWFTFSPLTGMGGNVDIDYVYVGPNTCINGDHTAVTDKAVAATCTATGKTAGSHCSVCNAVIKAQTTVAALGHNYAYKATKNPTTSATGTLTGTCSRCSTTTTVTLPKLNTTDYTKTVTTAATCTATGVDTYKWKTTTYGTFSFTATTAATGHSYTYKATKNPTTSATGTLTGTCSKCSGTTTVTLPKLNTTDYTKTVTKAPTCTETGTDTYKWKTTTYGSFSFTATTAATGHSYTYKATKNPTTSATGTLTGTCSKCSGTTTITLPKLNTTDYTKTVTKAPTCTETGTDTYKWNTTTYGNFSFTATTNALGHSYTAKVTAPTCTAQGYTTHTCSRCSDSYKDTYTNATGHSYTYKATKNPTTSATGTLTGTCSKCSGTTTVSLPKLNTTDYTKTVTKAATCTATGTDTYKWNTTTYGSFSFTATTNALGHSYTYKATKNPTTSATGTLTGTCSKCSGTTTVTLPKLNTTDYTKTVTKAPTCTETGTDTYKWKTTTYGSFSFTATTAATGHSYTYKATKNPTTSATGTLTGTCSKCSGTTTVTLPKLNTTDYTKTMTKAPTCTATGTDTYKWKTTTYGSFSFTATTAATGHSYTYKATKNPTTSATGTLTGTCSKCSGTTTVTLPKLNTTDYTKTVTKAATCTATGTDTYKWNTTTYGSFSFTATTAALGHSYTAKVTAPTCTARGYTTHTCSRCSDSYKDTYTNATGHSYTYKATKDPTTSATGTLTGTCSKCSGTTTVTLPKLSTTDYTKTVTKAATCTATGTDIYKWKTTTYGTFSFTATTNALGHSYTAKVTAPTCTAQGYTTHTCSRCSNSYKDTYTNATGHSYTSKVTTAATCTKDGVKTFTCSKCNHSYTEAIAATGHTEVIDKAVAATCTTDGKTEGSHCSVCNAVIKAQTTIPATGHSYTSKVTTAATCTKAGVKTFTCSKCSHSYTEAIAATGHTEVVDKAVAATCTTAGKTEGSHCSVCSAVIKAQTTISATGHSYTSKVTTAATCTKAGVKTFTCSKCNHSYTEAIAATGHTEVIDKAVAATCTTDGKTEGSHCSVCNAVIKAQTTIPATGHSYTSKVTTAATCTKAGVKTFTCSKCSHSYTEAIAATGHTEVIDKAVAATCTTAGKTEGSHCSVCNAVIKAQTTVPATGHSYTSKVTTAATCTKDGVKTFACSKCSHSYTEAIAATGHTEVVDKAVAATCTTAGKTEGSHCSVCNAVIKAQTTVPATGHSYASTVTTAATCTKNGVKTFTCSKCSHSYTEAIAATGHTEVIDKAVAATCTTAGKTEGSHCSVCNAVIKAQTSVPATGHSYTSKVTTAATCTKDGVKTFTCSKCSNTYTEAIAATGHTEVVDKAVAATCTTAGKTEGSHCSVCNTVIKAQTTVPATGHSYSYKSNGNGTHTVTCARCNDSYTENHNFGNGTCVCGDAEITLDESIKILHTLDLASDISVTFAVQKTALANYDSYYLECVLPEYSGNTLVGTSTVEVQPVVSGNYYYFTLTGITAVRMGDMVEAVLHMTKGGQEYISKTDSYSVATYAYGMLNSSKDAKMLTLCADLLRYGAEAQAFKGYRTDALVDADMTEVHRSYLSNTETLTFTATDSYMGDLASPTITWVGKTLDLGSKVGMKFVFSTKNYSSDLSKLSMKVTYQGSTGETKVATLTGIEAYNANNKQYSFTFYGLLASELRTVVDVAIYEGNTQLSETLRYSAESYAAKTSTTALAALTKALFAYSDSAKAFFAK